MYEYVSINSTKEQRLAEFRKSYIPSIWEESEEQYTSRHLEVSSMVIKDGLGNPIGRWDETDF